MTDVALVTSLDSLLATVGTTLSDVVSHALDVYLLEDDSFAVTVTAFLEMTIECASGLAVSAACPSGKTNIFLCSQKCLFESDGKFDDVGGWFSVPLSNLSILLGSLVIPDLLLSIHVINGSHCSIAEYLKGSASLSDSIAILAGLFHLLNSSLIGKFDFLLRGRKGNSQKIVQFSILGHL